MEAQLFSDGLGHVAKPANEPFTLHVLFYGLQEKLGSTSSPRRQGNCPLDQAGIEGIRGQ
jgi:hypothetical protein